MVGAFESFLAAACRRLKAGGTTARLMPLMLPAVLLAGCTTVPVFHETGNTSDLRWWRTESRTQWRWYGLPVGTMPSDVYFSTQDACEGFRRSHPAYTKPEEVCRPVYGVLTKVPAFRKRTDFGDRDRELDACGADEACRKKQLCERYRAAGRTDICSDPSAAPSAE